MKARSESARKRKVKSTVPFAALWLFVALLVVAAVLVNWRPWERPPSNATNSTGAAMANPAGFSIQSPDAMDAIHGTDSAAATNDVLKLMKEGNELVFRGDTEGAIQKYRAAMKLNPEDEEIHFNLAFAYARQGRTNDAIQSYTEALRIYPDHADAHINLGNLLVGLRRHIDALEHFSAALKMNPENSLALNNLGRCLAELGKHKESIQQFSEAIRLNPGYLEARFNLATSQSVLGNYAEAISQFEQCLRMEPAFTPARRGIERARAKMASPPKP